MKVVTNCKNCGAALNPWKPSCEFCGTKNVNLTALDLASGEPANFIFKLPKNIKVVDKDGADIYMTTLAVPSLEFVTVTQDSFNIYGGYGMAPLARYSGPSTLEMQLKLSSVTRPENNSLCELRVGEPK